MDVRLTDLKVNYFPGGKERMKRFSKGKDVDFTQPSKLFGNNGRLKICVKVGSTPTVGIYSGLEERFLASLIR